MVYHSELGGLLLPPGSLPDPKYEGVGEDVVVDDITRRDMAKLWSTEYLLGWDDREILVCRHRLNR